MKLMHFIFTAILCILILFYAIVFPYAGKVEGKLFPVLTNAEILHYESIDYNTTRIMGYGKLSRECDFLTNKIYFTEYGVSTLVQWRYQRTFRIWDTTEVYWGPWILNITEEQLKSGNLYIMAEYQCHPFYTTEVAFHITEDVISFGKWIDPDDPKN